MDVPRDARTRGTPSASGAPQGAGHRYDTITFLTDYGTGDEFVGVVKSVLRSIAPHAVVVDLTHGIAPHDVQAGALALGRSVQYLCPGVVLAVVDPGVGTDRRAVAVEVGGGESVLVGPDNGLLAPAVAMCGGATAAVELTSADHQLAAPGATFAGRDVFAPAAAHLCNGVPLPALGEPVDPATLLPATVPLPREGDDGALACQVLWVDRFGNCQLNAGPDELAHLGREVQLRWGDGQSRTGVLAAAYGELGPGQVGLVVDSYGLVSISLPRRSAAVELDLAAGSEVTLAARPADRPDGEGRGAPSPVTLSPRRPG